MDQSYYIFAPIAAKRSTGIYIDCLRVVNPLGVIIRFFLVFCCCKPILSPLLCTMLIFKFSFMVGYDHRVWTPSAPPFAVAVLLLLGPRVVWVLEQRTHFPLALVLRPLCSLNHSQLFRKTSSRLRWSATDPYPSGSFSHGWSSASFRVQICFLSSLSLFLTPFRLAS